MDTSKTDGSQRIYASDITGYWHFVFINVCYTMSTDEMAIAFTALLYLNGQILKIVITWKKFIL